MQQELIEMYRKKWSREGNLLGRFEFKTKGVDSIFAQDYKDGILPWIRIEDAKLELPFLLDPDEIVCDEQTAIVVIDYPVQNPVQFEIKSASELGFTRKEFVLKLQELYLKMYEEEEETATVKTIPPGERKKLYNRNFTDGKYGIWGHDLGDLILNDIEIREKSDGTVLIYLIISS